MKTGRSASAAPSCPDWLARGSMRHMVSVEIDRVEQFHLGELSSAIADGAGASRLGAPAGSRLAAAKEANRRFPQRERRCLIETPVVRCCCPERRVLARRVGSPRGGW